MSGHEVQFFSYSFVCITFQSDHDCILYLFLVRFVEQLDDIAFSLCKMDVLGKHLERACTKKHFETEFEKPTMLSKNSKRISLFLKGVYFFNLAIFLAILTGVAIRQERGLFQCHSITVEFPDDIWAESWARGRSGTYMEQTLMYSYFNGVYVQDGTHAGRPVYKERRKFDRTEYEGLDPAEIRYCKEISSWIFTHGRWFLIVNAVAI